MHSLKGMVEQVDHTVRVSRPVLRFPRDSVPSREPISHVPRDGDSTGYLHTVKRMRMWPPVVLALLLLAIPHAQAARPYTVETSDPLLEPWRWQKFSHLSGKGLECMLGDPRGHLWFGTASGVYRYDGLEWSHYPVPKELLGSGIYHLALTREGVLYAGSDRSLSRMQDETWQRVFPIDDETFCPITGIATTGSKGIWASTPFGILHVDPTGTSLYADAANAAWVQAISGSVTVHHVPDALIPVVPWPEDDVVGAKIEQNVIYAVADEGPASDAGLAPGDRIVEGIDQLNGPSTPQAEITVERGPENTPFTTIIDFSTPQTGLREWQTRGVFEDSQGRVWMGILPDRYGYFKIDAEGKPYDWHIFGPEAHVSVSDPIPVFAELDDGTIVAASAGNRSPPHLYRGDTWRQYDMNEIGGRNYIRSILKSSDGMLWLGGIGGHLQNYRNGAWTAYAGKIPVEFRRIVGLVETADGSIWLGFSQGNILRLEYGKDRWLTFRNLHHRGTDAAGRESFQDTSGRVIRYTPGSQQTLSYGLEDGILDKPSRLIITKQGSLWVVGSHEGVAATSHRVDDKWITTKHKNLAHSTGHRIGETSDGAIWVPSHVNLTEPYDGGIVRYNGRRWTHLKPMSFDQAVGLGKIDSRLASENAWSGAPYTFYTMSQTSDGKIWMGHFGGLFNFSSLNTVRVTDPDFVRRARVQTSTVTQNGVLWVGTRASGILSFDGETWSQYVIADGLVDDNVHHVEEGPDGSVWVGTTGGISRFDGVKWTTQAHLLNAETDFYVFPSFSTTGDLYVNRYHKTDKQRRDISTTRYVAETIPPETTLREASTSVAYGGNTIVSWSGTDRWSHTPESELHYSYRLNQEPWSPFSTDKVLPLRGLESGTHRIEVRTRDRDFNVDPTPVTHHFTVAPPVWLQTWFIGLVAVFVALLTWQGQRIVSRTRERNQARDQLLAEAEAELNTARDMQMGMLPHETLSLPRYEVAGRCRPATHVGGDFIKYAHYGDRFYIALADVTGHGMEAAIPVVMFGGILENYLEEQVAFKERMPKLNRAMLRTLDRRSFICCSLAEFDIGNQGVDFAIAGFPPPYHYDARSQQTREVEVSAFPLGVRANASYPIATRTVNIGDYLVFCSDGLIEAEDSNGEILGYKRTASLIASACRRGLSAELTLESILKDMDNHRGGTPQSDDVTCVVVHCVNDVDLRTDASG